MSELEALRADLQIAEDKAWAYGKMLEGVRREMDRYLHTIGQQHAEIMRLRSELLHEQGIKQEVK